MGMGKANARGKTCCEWHHSARHAPRDFNIFLSPRGPGARTSRCADSPVYSLSSASGRSPGFWVGVEGAVVQVDVVGVAERWPDPVFGLRGGWAEAGARVSDCWDPRGDVLCLAVCEQVEGGPGRLRVQRGVGEGGGDGDGEGGWGWDGRWV